MVWQFHVLFAIALGDPDFISMAKLLFLEGGGIRNFISWLTPIYPVQKLGFWQAILCNLFGMVKWPFQWQSDLHLGYQKVTSKKLVITSNNWGLTRFPKKTGGPIPPKKTRSKDIVIVWYLYSISGLKS